MFCVFRAAFHIVFVLLKSYVMINSFTLVSHLCSVVLHPSSVISSQLQSLIFTPIRRFRALGTDFCVLTVLNRHSPEKCLTEGFLGNSLSTARYLSRLSKSLMTDFERRRTSCEWSLLFFLIAILTKADD